MSNESLDPPYAVVFANPENGTPDNITQAGCLALARRGKEAWNAWREKYPVNDDSENRADFTGYKFTDLNFENFIFGYGASFRDTEFKNEAFFKNAIFEEFADFEDAKFLAEAIFIGTEFGNSASFKNAKFSNDADFEDAQFGDNADFANAEFASSSWFERSKFNKNTSFYSTQFNEGALFQDAQFGDWVAFDNAKFLEKTDFTRTTFSGTSSFVDTQFGDRLIFFGTMFEGDAHFKVVNKNSSEKDQFNPSNFKSVSFAGSTFKGRADFSGRTFTAATSFGRVIKNVTTEYRVEDEYVIKVVVPKGQHVTFGKAPLFHGCKLHQDTTFDGAEYPKPSSDPTENDTAARAYRSLKLAFSQHQATREEQFFFRKEMAEETARAPCTLKWLFWLYSRFSDYGFSLWRPMVLLFLTLPIFALIYSCLACLTPCWLWTEGCQIKSELWQFTLMQALPLPGFDKWSESLRECLFLKHPSAWLPFFVMLHKTIALLALFLSGLALRNLFKMK